MFWTNILKQKQPQNIFMFIKVWNHFLISLRFSTKFVFFEHTWLFYLKFNLSKSIYFLKRTWFIYVLFKYHGMFKVLQWNTRLWKTPTLKIAASSPVKLNIYRSCIKSSIAKYIKFELKIILIYLTSIINAKTSFGFIPPIFHYLLPCLKFWFF